jgi:hypothetical protein
MPASAKPKLTEKQWRSLRAGAAKAAKLTAAAIKDWSALAAKAVNGSPHADWRWLLMDFRNRCIDDNIDCPYSVTYLVQLAETYTAVEGNLDRGIAPSVLVEGRNLDNLLDIIEEEKENLTVPRVRAYVTKEATGDERPVEDIEAEQKAERDQTKERKTRKRHAEKIEGWDLDKSDKLLPAMKSEITAYRGALLRLQADGSAFDGTELTLALDAAKQLVSTLEEMQRSQAKLKKAA